MDSKTPMVTVWCLTFNHNPYIRQCLEGFVEQKTDFKFEVLVHDDASTDGTQDIILEYQQKYPDLIKPLLEKENQYSKHDGSLMRLQIENCQGRYIAFCEGDDYWTDPLKLQKQVDFLEAHPDYGLCHTDFVLSDRSRRKHYSEHYPDGNYFPGLLLHENAGIGTLTVLFRKETFDRTPKFYLNEPFVAGDTPRWIELAKEAKIKYIPEVTAAYRILPQSASHHSSFEKDIAFREGLQNIRLFYAEKYNIKLTDFRNYYTNLLKCCYKASESKAAEKYYNEAKSGNYLTMKGRVFYLGAKNRWLHRLIDVIITPK